MRCVMVTAELLLAAYYHERSGCHSNATEPTCAMFHAALGCTCRWRDSPGVQACRDLHTQQGVGPVYKMIKLPPAT